MKNLYPPYLEKFLPYIERTRERLGWLVVNVYRFPMIEGFGGFLEAVQRCLTRHGVFSWYLWTKNLVTHQYLLVHVGRGQWTGHFEAECSVIIPRLWQRYSAMPYLISGTIRIDGGNQNDLGDWLARFLSSTGPQHLPGWHQRSYGTAQIPWSRQKNPPVRGDWIGAA